MKKIYTTVLALVMLMASGCSTGLLGGLGDILGGV